MSSAARLLLALLAVQVACHATLAQDGEGITQEQNRTIYDARYFAQFNAITADDLLRRIPSIQDLLPGTQTNQQSNEEQKRGFGTTGEQVLINGRRLSGKSNSIEAALKRIQASNVERIEVIRGSVPGLDVRSEGTLVNVVLREVLSEGSGTWEGRLSRYSGKNTEPGGRVSYSGTWGPVSYVLSVDSTARFERRRRSDFFFRPTATALRVPEVAPFQRIDQLQRQGGNDNTGSASLSYTSSGGNIWNVNAQIAEEGTLELLPALIFQLGPGGDTLSGATNNILDTELVNWEVGSDYEYFFETGSLKILAIYTSSAQDDDRRFFIAPLGGAERQTRTQLQSTDRTEKILRGTYRWQPAPAHAVEVGGEAALNTLDAGIAARDLVTGFDVRLFNPNATIEETRFETFASYAWQPLPALSIEAALDSEYSRFSQDGDDVNSKSSFFFLKPRLDLRYDVSARNQVRARIQRTIGQLNFADFVPSFNTEDFRLGSVRAGNENLVPEKEWLYELTLEHRIAEDQGVLTARGYYIRVSDRIERIPVTVRDPATGRDVTLSATGNIGSGETYGVELKAGVRLGWINLPRASIDVSMNFHDSQIADPFSGEKRIFSMIQKFNLINFRHELDWRNLSYGFSINNRLADRNHDLDFAFIANPKPAHNAFAEMRALEGLTVRLDVNRIFKTGARRELYLYPSQRRPGLVPRQVELRKSHFAREVRLTLRGTF